MKKDSLIKAITVVQTAVASSDLGDVTLMITGNAIILFGGSTCLSCEMTPDVAANSLFGERNAVTVKTEEMVDKIYKAYPRRRDPKAAKKAIVKAMFDNSIPLPVVERPSFVLDAVIQYAKFTQDCQIPRDKIPYPATWFNRGSYLNRLESEQANKQRTGTQRTKGW